MSLSFTNFCRIYNYSAIWDDLRTLSQVWKRVLLPAEDDFSQGISRAIYMAVRGVWMWILFVHNISQIVYIPSTIMNDLIKAGRT